jgi:hypothetical protein
MSEWLLIVAALAAILLVLGAFGLQVGALFDRARRERDEEYRRLIEHGDADVRNLR